MKTSNSIGLFIFLFLFVAGVFLFLNNSVVKNENNKQLTLTLGDVSSCHSDKIGESILKLPANTVLLGAFISFQDFPLSVELKNKISNLGVALDENSLVFDYLWSSIPIEHLCDLVNLDEVKSVFTLNK